MNQADRLDFPVVTTRYHAFHKQQPLLEEAHLVPVRTSAGTPRFIDGARDWPRCNEIVPWNLLKIEDDDEFKRRYFERLEKHGPAKIAVRLTEIHVAYGNRPLALLCFEDVHAGEVCHRRMFAEWWAEHTGQQLDELTA